MFETHLTVVGKLVTGVEQRRFADGSVVAFGTFQVHQGVGQFSKTLRVRVGALRGARLVTSSGSAVAQATFA